MKSLKNRLQDFGFTEYESSAYLSLIKMGVSSAGMIVSDAGIPQGRIYNVLGALETRGFCTVSKGQVKKYKAVSPDVAFNQLVVQKQLELQEAMNLKEELEEEFENRQVQALDGELVEVLTSKDSQVQKFNDLVVSSSKTLYSFNKKPYATGFLRDMAEIKRSAKPLREIIASGVKVKAIFEREDEHQSEFLAMLKYYESIGEEVRIADSLPIKMLLSDEHLAMVSLKNYHNQKQFNLSSMVIRHTDLSDALTMLFTNAWERSMTLKEYADSIHLKEQNHES